MENSHTVKVELSHQLDSQMEDLTGRPQVSGIRIHLDRELLNRFESHLLRQGHICEELESLADQLPDAVDSHSCLSLAQRLPVLVKTAHEFEEDTFFPAISEHTDVFEDLTSVLERLKFEHWGDEDFAEDVRNALRNFVSDREHTNVESLAWMLRGFFEGMRRHLAFEREHILPLARRIVELQH